MPKHPNRRHRRSQRGKKAPRRANGKALEGYRTENGVIRYSPPVFNRTIVHRFTRVSTPITITNSTVTDSFFSFNFQLAYLPGYTEFTSLYDQYRIDSVLLRFIPAVMTSSPLDPLNGFIAMAVDYDDINNPASMDQLYQYGNCSVYPANREIIVRVRPRAALAAYSGTFTSYANMGNMWIDIASPSVQHYGLKAGYTASTPVHSWNVFITYMLSLRSSR